MRLREPPEMLGLIGYLVFSKCGRKIQILSSPIQFFDSTERHGRLCFSANQDSKLRKAGGSLSYHFAGASGFSILFHK